METHRDVILLGGSLGGFDALRSVLSALTTEDVTMLCVLHSTSEGGGSRTAKLLQEVTDLEVEAVDTPRPLERSKLYLPISDHHLLVDGDQVLARKGPRENRARPAIDVLFRTAAVALTGRVVGCVLSGTMDDGVAGLQAVKECGGVAIVQAPETARYPELPVNALDRVEADAAMSPVEIGAAVERWANQPTELRDPPPLLAAEARLSLGSDLGGMTPLGATTHFTCPDCGGPLWEASHSSEETNRYRCHTGHAYTSTHLDAAYATEVEAALYTALRILEERTLLLDRLASRGESAGKLFDERARESEQLAEVLRRAIRRTSQ